ncbi:MAG: hypothetical protein Q9165_000054 [Trypethelium subeluteriae]
MLPTQLIQTLNREYPCRELQIRHLSALLSPTLPSPSTIVLHGLEATGKTSVIKQYLYLSKLPHAIVSSRECITGRHLLERTLAACVASVAALPESETDTSTYSRCENLSALAAQLQRLLEGHEKFFLVLDGVDRQRDAPTTLFPALARLGEMVNMFAIHILSLHPPPIFVNLNEEYTAEEHEEDRKWLWPRFLVATWDSLAKGAARDVVRFRQAAEMLWEEFVAPIRKGEYGTRDFSRLMVRMRGLFQKEDVLVHGIVPREKEAQTTIKRPKKVTLDLPYFSKYLLCAAYLASYNPIRQDPIFFMKSTEKKRRRRGGGGTPGRAPKSRKIPRNLLHPSAFSLDRLLAILHAVVPHAVPQTADIYTQISTLASLRLLSKAGAAGTDLMDLNTKWRVGVGWDVVNTLARSVGLEMTDYLAE